MNTRIDQSDNSHLWWDLSISQPSQATSNHNNHFASPSSLASDPWDIDHDISSKAQSKNLSRPNNGTGDNNNDIGDTPSKLMSAMLSRLGIQDQNDGVPKVQDKGKGGGCGSHPGSDDRSNGHWDGKGFPFASHPKDKSHIGGDEDSKHDHTSHSKDRSKNHSKDDNTVHSKDRSNKSDPTSNESDPTSKTSGPSSMPEPTGTVTVNEPIVVKAGEVFDGGGKLYKAGSNLGDGGQSEHQKPVFIIEPGGTLKNLQYQGADGIHTMGDATIKDVWNRDVGEDAMTMKKPGNVTWSGGGAFGASDKIFQLNAGGSFTLENFTADGFGKAIRTNGGHNIDTDITVRNSHFTNGDEAIVRTDASLATVTLEGVTFSNVPNDVLAPDGTKVVGAVKRGHKAFSG